jgi:hypothetical protein
VLFLFWLKTRNSDEHVSGPGAFAKDTKTMFYLYDVYEGTITKM